MTAKKSKRSAGTRLREAASAGTARIKKAVTLTPEQQKVFAVTLVTVLLSGGGIGTLVDKMRTEEYDTKFQNGVSGITNLQATVDVLQQTQEALQIQITALLERVDGIEKEPTTIRQEFEGLKGEIAGFQATWEKKQNHEHKFGDWQEPVQIEGNFVTPQFFQHRNCLICGQTDARSTF